MSLSLNPQSTLKPVTFSLVDFLAFQSSNSGRNLNVRYVVWLVSIESLTCDFLAWKRLRNYAPLRVPRERILRTWEVKNTFWMPTFESRWDILISTLHSSRPSKSRPFKWMRIRDEWAISLGFWMKPKNWHRISRGLSLWNAFILRFCKKSWFGEAITRYSLIPVTNLIGIITRSLLLHQKKCYCHQTIEFRQLKLRRMWPPQRPSFASMVVSVVAYRSRGRNKSRIELY